MDFLKILTDNFWTTVVLFLFIITIVSIVLGIWLEAFKVRTHSAQKMQELRNEELRLQLKLAQQKEGRGTGS
jgi:ABC-type siderophore export system fused ATPase/permease subunit